ncbi:hypothetical protein [Streptomyces milbemycinicus]
MLAAIPDLQCRADQSPEALFLSGIRGSSTREPARRDQPAHQLVTMVWPKALQECLAEDERFHTTLTENLSLGGETWQLRLQEADIVHRMFGLLSHAANPRHIDLSDHPELIERITQLYNESQRQGRR